LRQVCTTELIHIEPLSRNLVDELANLSRIHLDSGIESAMSSAAGQSMVAAIQAILDKAGVKMDDQLFIRLGATSAKDSFALNVPTTKPTQLPPKSDIILRRILTSGRTVGRILALSEHIWPADPGEAMIIQRWSPQVQLASEFRVFCYEGRVTAISQDIWWEKLGWRERYSDGLVQAITKVWESTKDFLPFKTCTMDVLVTPPDTDRAQWTAGIIEFNGFGAHLNTGSDLFHWINDADILQGRQSGITIRFVDDWEEDGAIESGRAKQNEIVSIQVEEQIEEDAEPDWFALEKKLKSQYGQLSNAATKLSLAKAAKLPLRGRWCSAY